MNYITHKTFTNTRATFTLWVIFFCYALVMALLFQKLVLPLTPSLNAVNGLLPNDAQYFDLVARELAEKINNQGWSAWHIFPAVGATGNVAILGAIYAVFGYDPALIIPLNAALHASAGLLVCLIAYELADRSRVGLYAGVVAGTLFVLFPTALSWYGQNHKDVYAITGIFLVLYSWILALNARSQFGWIVWASLLCGIFLVGIARPYSLKLLLLVILGAFFLFALYYACKKDFPGFLKKAIYFLISLTIIIIAISGFNFVAHQRDSLSVSQIMSHTGETYQNWSAPDWSWKKSNWIPRQLDSYVELAAKTRAGFIAYGVKVGAKSMIDPHIKPQSVADVAAYVPRALQVGLFSPFPSTWQKSTGITNLVAYGEMLIYYFCLLGLCLCLWFNRQPAILACIYFSCALLFINAFVMPNVGTLYRIRFAYIFVLIILGLLGWFTWLHRSGLLDKASKYFRKMSSRTAQITPNTISYETQQEKRKATIWGSAIVAVLTLFSFIGFFLRDLLLVKHFGLSAQADSFFITLAIPMFVISFFYMPLGQVLIPHYLDLKKRLVTETVASSMSSIFSWILISLILFCLALYWLAPYFIGALYNKGPHFFSEGVNILDVLPILFVGGWVITANALLNASKRVVLTSSAQLITPVMAIAALLFFGNNYGIEVVVYAMIAGLVINFIIVSSYTKRLGLSLFVLEKPVWDEAFFTLLKQLLSLTMATFFVVAAPLIASFLALSLPEGAVSAINLGNKVVLFITGMIAVVISTSILPYFSGMIARNDVGTARAELSFFLLVSTLLFIIFTVLLYAFAEQLVRLIFYTAELNNAELTVITDVMRYSSVQIPFFVCSTLLIRFLIASRSIGLIALIALIGLFVNVSASIFIMKHMGVAGIAIGASLSVMISTLMLLIVSLKYSHVRYFDALVILMSWLLFITCILSIHLRSIPSIIAIVASFFILYISYFTSISIDRLPKRFIGIFR